MPHPAPSLSRLSEETRLKLWNVSSSKNVLQLPSILHHLPHLLNREDSLQPAVHLGQGRTGVSIVMGVPSVKREVHSYLTDTLSSLMSELSPAEKDDCVIVVFIAEVSECACVCPCVSVCVWVISHQCEHVC